MRKNLWTNLYNSRSLRVALPVVAGAAFIAAIVPHGPGDNNGVTPPAHTEWKDYGGGPDHSKFMNFTQINKQNVSKLEPAFVYSTASDRVNSYKFNPIIVDGIMYVLAKNNSLVATDATTGKELWIHANLRGIIQRGINFWQSKDKKQKRFIITLGGTLQAIDAITGKSILTFGNNGSVDLKEGIGRAPELISRGTSTSAGHIFENLILLGSAPGEDPFSAPGDVRAFDVITGKLKWVFHTIPHPGEYGYDTWPKDAWRYSGAANTWGEISVDEKRGIAYFPLGSPTYDYDGVDREGANLFGNSIIALDARTGKRLWHFQTVHHDIWDYDLTAAPQLITINHNGKKVDAVAVASKNGFMYVFDRVTGKPIWPIKETPFPRSDLPGEKAWATQPIPTVVPPFNRHSVDEKDINPYLPDSLKQKYIARIKAAKTGLYQPLSDKYEVFALPGSVGGANQGNTAANPAKGMVYVMYQEMTCFYQLVKRSERAPRGGGGGAGAGAVAQRGQAAYVQYCQSCHGADRNGVAGAGVSLVDVGTRLTADVFKTYITQGKGRMPAQPHIDEAAITAIYTFLNPGGPGGRGGRGPLAAATTNAMPDGPVVASGGAPLTAAANAGGFGGGMRDYPADYTGPKSIYVEKNNWGTAIADILAPPFAGLVAYDLNKGTIKWKIPLGEYAKSDVKGLGTPNGTQNKGMVVTASGLIFATCADGKVRAIDADNGKILWEYDLGRSNPSGIPAMYQANGRQYLVVCSTGALLDKNKKEEDVPKGYITFALPKLK
ncbi:MAG: quinoprotein glucose dehydrogenase [Sphingobacteriaceae bacterium]|nr:MAG: quinoprotein glucose dehydrogenase [Sphingobacteriaceae bacterium]